MITVRCTRLLFIDATSPRAIDEDLAQRPVQSTSPALALTHAPDGLVQITAANRWSSRWLLRDVECRGWRHALLLRIVYLQSGFLHGRQRAEVETKT